MGDAATWCKVSAVSDASTTKIPLGTGIRAAAKALRNLAELTAKGTQNWDNYEAICLQVLEQAYAGGSNPSGDSGK
jgi:hypothetical protein